ncbi:MAG: hypothetical protein KatS3mg023_2417 [Armatimonadota bacterium]|nr:MAG: hypothetical protein KatS3mg023_2417 [Armatimonadota bacterium]
MNPRGFAVFTMTWVIGMVLFSTAHAVTFTDVDTYGIQYSASVTPVSGNLYDVSVTINTTGYTGTQNAWLDWFNLKVSPQNPASVSNLSLPTGWSHASTSPQAGKVQFESTTVNAPPESSDIAIPVVGTKPVVTLSYRVDLTGTSLKMDVWPYQARYLFATSNPRNPYTQTIVSRQLRPQGAVIPEPMTLLLFGMGLAVPLIAHRRK